MATALGIAMKITASAAGMKSGTEEAAKLLNKLSSEADRSAKGFQNFTDKASGELPGAMADLGSSLQQLSEDFVNGGMTADEFKASFQGITDEAKEMTAAFEQGARMTKELRTVEERRGDELARIAKLQKVGAISEQTANRARAEATGANKAAADAAAKAATQQAKAAQVIQSTLTPMERYGQEVAELDALLEQGLLTQSQYNKAVGRAQASYDKASAGAKGFQKTGKAVKKQTMEFNELSGILGVLPGQFGAIAARISSFASAGQGLTKLFSGGLKGAIGNIGASLTAMINPATIAIAAFAGIAVGIVSLTKGLISLASQTQKLEIEAAKLGTSFQFMQSLTVAAERTGESVDTLRVGFTALLRNIDAARKGSKSQVQAFADLGISAEDLASKKPEEIFKMVGEALNTIEDPAMRTAAALKTVGENGGRLQPAFKALAEATADVIRFNSAISDLDRSNIAGMRNSFEDLQQVGAGLIQSLTIPFASFFKSVTQGLSQYGAALSRNMRVVLDALTPIINFVGVLIQQLLNVISVISNVIGLAFEPLAAYGVVVGQVITNIGDVLHSMTVFINDMINSVRQVVRNFGEWIASGQAVSSVLEFFSDTFSRVTAIVVQLGKNIGIMVGSVVERFNALVESSPLIEIFANVITGAFNGVMAVVNSFIGIFTNAVDNVLSFFEWLVGVGEEVPEIEVPVNTDQIENAADIARDFYSEITSAADKAKDLGNEGFAAALKYQEQLQMIADLIADGELTGEEGARGVDNATAAYERKLSAIEKSQEANRKAAEEAQKAAQKEADAHNKVIDSLLEEQRIRDNFGGSKERAKAAENVTAVTKEIEQVELQLAEARASGDQAAIDALTTRLSKLDQIREQEKDVASGAAAVAKKVEDSLNKAAEAAQKAIDSASGAGPKIQEFAKEFESTLQTLKAQLQLDIISPEQFEEAAEKARKQFDEDVKREQKLAGLRDKLNEKSAEIEQDRLASLNKRIQEPLEINDIRSSEGAQTLLDTLTGREDPAIEEYRKQLAKLEEIKAEIANEQNQPVERV